MKRKYILVLTLLILDFVSLSLSASVLAQTTYEFDLKEDDSFTWEIKELNIHNFEKVFGFEPTYEVGDQMKKTVRNVLEISYGWSLSVETWDYDSSFNTNGSIDSVKVFKDPKDYIDNLFIPTPVNDYLAEVANQYSEYSVEGAKITKQAEGPNGDKYTLELEYDSRGVKASEVYTDDDDIVLVRIEGTFKIPMGNYFIGILVGSVTAIVFVLVKKRPYRVIR